MAWRANAHKNTAGVSQANHIMPTPAGNKAGAVSGGGVVAKSKPTIQAIAQVCYVAY
jgi:hypothetical protein